MNPVSTVGLDLAKHIFQLHGADSAGAVVFRKKLRRGQEGPAQSECAAIFPLLFKAEFLADTAVVTMAAKVKLFLTACVCLSIE